MIDYTTIRSDVESYLAGTFNECFILFENLPMPENEQSELIEVFDDIDFTQLSSIGATTQMIEGTIVIHILTPRNTGTERNRQIAVVLSDLLAGKIIGSIQFKEAEYISVVQDTMSVYFQRNLHISYVVDYGGVEVNC
jgi:hypothetical protein